MINGPSNMTIALKDGTRITGTFRNYSDPRNADAYGAFVAEDMIGGTTYILWAAIIQLTVFPLVTPDAA